MKKKTYRTYTLKKLYTFVRDAEGNRIDVVFQGGVQVGSTAKFTTSNPVVQEGLENNPAFGRDYFLESEREIETEPKEEKETPAPKAKKAEKETPVLTDVKDVKRFRNIVEMRNAMKELGLPVKDDSSYTECKSIAAKEGYDFQIKR